MKVKLDVLDRLTLKGIKKFGYTTKEAKVIKEILMYAQLRGNNQGIVKIVANGIKPKNPEEKPSAIVKKTKISELVDGGKRFAMLVMDEGTRSAIKKAKRFGVGIVGMKNTFSSTGALGYYARKIAEAGLMGMVFSGSPSTVNPDGSFEPKFGTNPMGFGITGNNKMYVFDMATSAMAYFGLVQAKTAGQSIPGDVAYDENGNLTTDPAKGMDGAIRPFDRSYKGYGLSLLVEMLTGPLVSAGFVGLETEEGWGNLIIAIDPAILVDPEVFKKEIDELLANVKTAKKLPGVEEIYIPGEKGDRKMKEALASGEIEIEDNLFKQLKEFVKST